MGGDFSLDRQFLYRLLFVPTVSINRGFTVIDLHADTGHARIDGYMCTTKATCMNTNGTYAYE